MGQYGNQPDFGTIVVTAEDVVNPFPPSAIYVGKTENNDGGTKLLVQPVGNAPGDTIEINGIYDGTFLPIIITEIISKDSVDLKNILLYR